MKPTVDRAVRRDKMKALRAKREEKVGAFYAVLSTQQKTVFDEQRKYKGRS